MVFASLSLWFPHCDLVFYLRSRKCEGGPLSSFLSSSPGYKALHGNPTDCYLCQQYVWRHRCAAWAVHFTNEASDWDAWCQRSWLVTSPSTRCDWAPTLPAASVVTPHIDAADVQNRYVCEYRLRTSVGWLPVWSIPQQRCIKHWVPAQLDHKLDDILDDGDQPWSYLLDWLLLAQGFKGYITLLRQMPDLIEEFLQPDIVLQRLAHLLYFAISCNSSETEH